MNLHQFADIHTHNQRADSSAIINLPSGTQVPDSGYFSVGLHPWHTADITEADLAWLDSTAAHPRVVAIGEAGLDSLRGADMARQEEIFRHHIDLSEKLQKPLIIHAVRTLPRIMQLRKQLRPSQPWIIHGYRGNATTARQLVALGIDISLGHKFNPEVTVQIAPEHIYHETDEQY